MLVERLERKTITTKFEGDCSALLKKHIRNGGKTIETKNTQDEQTDCRSRRIRRGIRYNPTISDRNPIVGKYRKLQDPIGIL